MPSLASRPTGRLRALVGLAVTALLSAGPLAAREPIRLPGRPVSVTPIFEPEGRFIGYEENDPEPLAMTTTGGGPTVAACLAYSPDGSSLAVGDRPNRPLCSMFAPINENGGLIRIIDLGTRRVSKTLRPAKLGRREYEVVSLTYAADGKTLVAHGKEVRRREGGGREVVYVVTSWDVARGQVVRRVESDRLDDWESLTFSADASAFATLTHDGFRVRDVATGRPRPDPEDAPLAPGVLAFSPDGRLIAAGREGGEVGLWEVATGRRVARFPAHRRGGNAFEVRFLEFSRDGRTLASGGLLRIDIAQFHAEFASELRLFDVEARSERRTIPSVEGGRFFHSAAFAPGGKTLALATSDEGADGGNGGVRIIDVATGDERAAATRGKGGKQVAYSRDGSLLVTADRSWISLRDPADGRERIVLDQEGYLAADEALALAPDGRTLATTSGRLQIWDLKAASAPPTAGGHRFRVTGLAYSPDGRTLASSSVDRTVRLWDLATSAPRATLVGHGEVVEMVAYAPDGRAVASVAADREVRIWDATTGACRANLKGPDSTPRLLSFAPDGKSLHLIAEDGDRPAEIWRWDVATGDPLPPPGSEAGRLSPLASSPDGGLVASWGHGRIEIRDAATWELRSRFPVNSEPLGLMVTRDGEAVFLMEDDHSIAIRRSGGSWSEEKLAEGGAEDESGIGRLMAATPDSRRIAAHLGKSLGVFDTATRRPLAILPIGDEEATWLAFSPDGDSLAVGQSQGDILIHDLKDAIAPAATP